MNAEVNALVTSAQSLTSVSRDAKLRIITYLILDGAAVDPTAVAALKAAAPAFQGWNEELNLNALIVAFANLAGVTTDGPALQALVDSAWGIPNGIVDAAEVQNLNWYGTLLLSGATLTNPAPLVPCWVAREVYGADNPSWLMFWMWLSTQAPKWFYNLYLKFGQRVAGFISNKPTLKRVIRKWMDSRIS